MTGMVGHLEGIKKSMLHRMEHLYRRRLKNGQVITYDMAEEMCELSLAVKREIGVIVDLSGRIELVVVGEAEALDQVPGIELPGTDAGLAKRYLIQTHLGWKPPSMGDQVTTLQFHFPLMAVLMAGTGEGFSAKFGEHPHFCDGAYLLYPALGEYQARQEQKRVCETKGPMTARQLSEETLSTWQEWTEPVFESHTRKTSQKERALLIGVHRGGKDAEAALEESLEELRQLAKTAGAQVLDVATQSRGNPDPATYIGSGKAAELALAIQQQRINLVIADDELSPAQQRNLERITRVKVIDRTELILDIFAQRAQSREGKIQVELAQLQYQMPRLKGRGRIFSQQTSVGAKGGIATRGPGETKLETDRRLLRERVDMLERESKEVVKHRQFQRQSRVNANIPTVALVGYTNAGKSTLMHALTQAEVLRENKLFATLDPTVRKLYLDPGSEVLLSDTVGFIRKLPTFLIQAFRATLEEVASADLLWHVWDVSHPERKNQFDSVNEVLDRLWDELGTEAPPTWTLCNKVDRLEAAEDGASGEALADAMRDVPNPYPISALTREGIPELMDALRAFMAGRQEDRERAAIEAAELQYWQELGS